MKQQEIENIKKMWSGCHICGTGNPTYSYIHRDIFGYFPCYDCWMAYVKESSFEWDVSRLFYGLLHIAGIDPWIKEKQAKYFYHDFPELGRRILRQIRNNNGIIEPVAECCVCKKTKPILDMGYQKNFTIKDIQVNGGVVRGGFVCFTCNYERWRKPEKKCVICGIHKREFDSSFVNNVCYSCGKIIDHQKEVRVRKQKELEERREKEKHMREAEMLFVVSDKQCIRALKMSGFEIEEIHTEAIELKRQHIIATRVVRAIKKRRKENESNHEDVYGKQQPNEKNHEWRIQARRSIGSAAGV